MQIDTPQDSIHAVILNQARYLNHPVNCRGLFLPDKLLLALIIDDVHVFLTAVRFSESWEYILVRGYFGLFFIKLA